MGEVRAGDQRGLQIALTAEMRISTSSSRLYAELISSRGAKRRLLGGLRSLLVKFSDPIVEMSVRNMRLIMPLSHAFPLYAHDDPEYDTAVVRLVESVVRVRGHCAVVDVGANVGYTARSLLGVPGTSVLCIEGNETLGRFISTNLQGFEGRYTWLSAYAGDPTARMRARSVMRAGTASLLESETASEISFVSLTQAVACTGFGTPDFVKIDTDGYDTKILGAELSFLAEHRPVLFFEFDPKLFGQNDPEGSSIVDRLAALGYRHGFAFSNHGGLLGAFRADQPTEFQVHAARIGREGVDYLDVSLFPTEAEFDYAYAREQDHLALASH